MSRPLASNSAAAWRSSSAKALERLRSGAQRGTARCGGKEKDEAGDEAGQSMNC